MEKAKIDTLVSGMSEIDQFLLKELKVDWKSPNHYFIGTPDDETDEEKSEYHTVLMTNLLKAKVFFGEFRSWPS